MNVNKNLISIVFTLFIASILIGPFINYFYAAFYVYDLPNSVNGSAYSLQGLINQFRYADEYMVNLYIGLKVALLGTFFSCLFSSMIAYGLSVFNFRYIKFYYAIIILMILIPEFAKSFPFFITLKNLNLLNNDLALWLPYITPSLAILIIKYYMDEVMNKEVLEAAKIDGAGEWRVFYYIVLPILKPAIAIVAVVQFTYFWTAYDLSVLIMAENSTKNFAHINSYVWPISILGALIVIVPCLVLIIASRSIIEFLNLYSK